MLIFITLLLIFYDAAFSLAQAADDPNGTTVQQEQSKNLPKASMKKAEDIKNAPRQEDNRSWFSRNKWWVALSVILTGGIAAAAASGGSNNDNSGSYHLEWR